MISDVRTLTHFYGDSHTHARARAHTHTHTHTQVFVLCCTNTLKLRSLEPSGRASNAAIEKLQQDEQSSRPLG